MDGLHVLLVDDDESQSEMYAIGLRHFGMSAKAATSAEDALDVLKHERIDVLICDVVMPYRDGYELMRAVRDAGNEVAAVAVSGLAAEEDRATALAAGFDEYLTKPCMPSELAAAVERVFAARRAIAPALQRALQPDFER